MVSCFQADGALIRPVQRCAFCWLSCSTSNFKQFQMRLCLFTAQTVSFRRVSHGTPRAATILLERPLLPLPLLLLSVLQDSYITFTAHVCSWNTFLTTSLFGLLFTSLHCRPCTLYSHSASICRLFHCALFREVYVNVTQSCKTINIIKGRGGLMLFLSIGSVDAVVNTSWITSATLRPFIHVLHLCFLLLQGSIHCKKKKKHVT